MSLQYSDSIPTQIGHHWVRSGAGAHRSSRIVEITEQHLKHGLLKHWTERKSEALACAVDEAQRQQLEALDDSHWMVEYAGPIPEPTN